VTAADCARFEALLENIHTSVRGIASGQVALIERLDRMEIRFDRLENRIEQVANQLTAIDSKLTAIDSKLTAIDSKLTAIDARLTAFAVDTQSRFERIERHLGLDGPSRSGKRARRGSPKRRKAS
jgi:chromosome segregation ATPase